MSKPLVLLGVIGVTIANSVILALVSLLATGGLQGSMDGVYTVRAFGALFVAVFAATGLYRWSKGLPAVALGWFALPIAYMCGMLLLAVTAALGIEFG